MLLRKKIYFEEGVWLILESYMRARGMDSPSMALDEIIKQLTRGTEGGRNNYCKTRTY